MERESDYINFMRGQVFYYKVIVGSIREGGVWYDELVLFEDDDNDTEEGGEVGVLARFVQDVGYDSTGSRDDGS